MNHSRKHALKFIIPMLFVSALSAGAGVTSLFYGNFLTALACFVVMGSTGIAASLADGINRSE